MPSDNTIPPDSFHRADLNITIQKKGSDAPPQYLSHVFQFMIIHDLNLIYRMAKLQIVDRSGISEMLPLSGNEIFTVKYKNQSDDHDAPKLRFESITSNEEIMESWVSEQKGITIYLVEYPVFERVMSHESIGFSGKTSDVIKKIIGDITEGEDEYYLNADIDDTIGEYECFTSPSVWSRLQTIKYLSQRTKNGPHYLYPISNFNEKENVTQNQFVYRSIQKLAHKSKDFRYILRYITNDDLVEGGVTQKNVVTDIKPETRNKLLSTVGVTNINSSYFDYEKGEYGLVKTDFKSHVLNKDIMFGEKTLMSKGEEKTIPHYRIAGSTKAEYLEDALGNELLEDQFKQSVLNVLAMGDQNKNVGDRVFLLLPSNEISEDSILDETLSGEWIISRIEHHISPDNRYFCYLVLERLAYFASHDIRLQEVE